MNRLKLLFKRICLVVISFGIMMLFQNCAPGPFHIEGSSSSQSSRALTKQDVEAIGVLQKSCAGCHANGQEFGGVGSIDDIDHLLSRGLLVPGDLNSIIYKEVISGEMPLGASMEDEDIETLKTWILEFNTEESVVVEEPEEEELGPPKDYVDPPTCTLTASATTYSEGQSEGVTLTLSIQNGPASYATIDGQSVDSVSGGDIVVRPEESRSFVGIVLIDGGYNLCESPVINVN